MKVETSGNILLFDGVCNLCNSLVKFIIKRDSEAKFKFASLQSAPGQNLLRTFGLSDTNFHSFVYIKGEKYFLKSTAALNLLKDLGGIWRIFYVFIIVPKSWRDFIYNRIAKSRYRIFGKRDECMVPTTDLKERFL